MRWAAEIDPIRICLSETYLLPERGADFDECLLKMTVRDTERLCLKIFSKRLTEIFCGQN